jgi:hypothetical protein
LDTGEEADLEPLAESVSLTGTRWLRYRTGGLRFDVTAYRRDLRASVVQAMGLHGRHPQRFGLAHVDRLRSRFGWNEFQLEGAVGLWLERGSLCLLSTKEPRIPTQTLVRFDLWKALDALYRSPQSPVSSKAGEDQGPLRLLHPQWARGSDVRLRSTVDGISAVVHHRCMSIGIGVQRIVEGGELPLRRSGRTSSP